MAKRTRRSLREYLREWSSKTYSRTVNTLKTLVFQFPHTHLRECPAKMQQKQCFRSAGIGCGNAHPLKGVLYIPGQTESYTRIRPPSLGATGPDACTARNQLLLAERFHRLAQLLDTGLMETLSDDEARAFVYYGQLALGIDGPTANRKLAQKRKLNEMLDSTIPIAAEVMAKYGPSA